MTGTDDEAGLFLNDAVAVLVEDCGLGIREHRLHHGVEAWVLSTAQVI